MVKLGLLLHEAKRSVVHCATPNQAVIAIKVALDLTQGYQRYHKNEYKYS